MASVIQDLIFSYMIFLKKGFNGKNLFIDLFINIDALFSSAKLALNLYCDQGCIVLSDLIYS